MIPSRLTRPVHGWLRLLLVAAVVLSMLSVDLSRAATGFAKEVDVIGTVDCGLRSGQRCGLANTLHLLTDSLSGEAERVELDISWIKDKLPGLDQDDEITVSVEVLPSGKLQALSVISARSRSGTKNPGQVNDDGKSQLGSAHGRQQDEDSGGGRQLPATGIGSITGTVRSLFTGFPIPGATVNIGSASATTNAAGEFVLSDIDAGTFTINAAASGFIGASQPLIVPSNITATAAFLLAQSLPDIVLTLIWGAVPADLDAHLSGPASGGGRFHLFFLDKNPETYASLTADTQSGIGPEQVVIRPDPGTLQYVAGEYRYWVHNFTGTPEFDGSQARVIVTKDSQLLATFDVGGATVDPSEELWHVVNLQVTAAGGVTLVPVQLFTNGSDLTVLRAPYGSKKR